MADPLHNRLCDLLGCEVPVLLAGMGGVARWELAAAVAGAGGFATLGMVREAPALIEAEVRALRAASDRPFAVNIIPAATDPALLDAQLACGEALGVPAWSFFWDVMPAVVARARASGALVLHQVGTLEAARAAEAAGADVLIAQGVEAGGHVHGREDGMRLALAIRAESRLPVVLSGGVATGADLARALAAGLDGVQCGTAFIATPESWAHDYHRQRIVAATGADTVLTDIFVLNWPKGAAVRVLENSTTRALAGRYLGHDPASLPREPIAWDDSAPLLRFSTDSPMRHTTGDLEAMALYAGTSAGRVDRVVPAAERLRSMAAEARALLAAAP